VIELTRATHYRQLAVQMRELAARAKYDDVREAYLSLAANWERLAAASEQVREDDAER
jgi:hypothetical protein